jgi:uncharacterized protein
MAGLTTGRIWRRLDTAGAEQALLDDGARRLHARGTMVAATPLPLCCRYELYTDDNGATARFEATIEGPGFVRSVRLERATGRWRVTASEQGNLDAALRRAGRPTVGQPGSEDPGRLNNALDVDLGYSPLTNTLPVRRLGLLNAKPGTSRTIDVAWVLVPSLEVVDSTQNYTVVGDATLSFTSGSFTAELTFDSEGYVTHYPGLAEQA